MNWKVYAGFMCVNGTFACFSGYQFFLGEHHFRSFISMAVNICFMAYFAYRTKEAWNDPN